MKDAWSQGDSVYWQYLKADARYTISKQCDGPTLYTAWYTPSGVGSWQALCPATPDVNVARKAAERHYGALQRRAA